MVGTELCTFNEIRKAISTELGIFIMYEPSKYPGEEITIHFASCSFVNIHYRDIPGVNTDQKFDKSKIKFYHYDSLEEVKIVHSPAIFHSIRDSPFSNAMLYLSEME